MRDAPSLTIVPALVGKGAQICVVDPQGGKEGAALLPGVVWEDDPYRAVDGADCLLILTEWNQFRALDLDRIASSMKTARLADLRNVYSQADARSAGFVATEGVGR
jgi:UDPglucose 6-dehydrogenase